MKVNEVLNAILSLSPEASMARQNKANFVVIPCEDGMAKVNVGVALAKDTKTCKAFNADAAKAEYRAWEAEKAVKEAEKASKPAKVKGVNPEAQARRDALDKAISEMPAFADYTATDILNALAGVVPENTLVMAIGSSAKRLVEAGTLAVREDEKGKKYYTKN